MLMSASPSSVLHRGSESPAPYANERGPVPRTTLQLRGPAPYANEREPLRRTSPGPGEPRPLC